MSATVRPVDFPPTPSPSPPRNSPTSSSSYGPRRIIRPTSMDGKIQGQQPPTNEGAKRDAVATHPADSQPGVTFAHQKDLKKLPIPTLEDTCRRYLDSLRPLQSKREHAETRAAVREFLHTDGPELQERLKNYAQDKNSYIEQFWYDSYLNYDNPVVLNLNPFFLLEDDPTPARNNQVTRAASLVVSTLAFVRALRKEELPPDKVRGAPLCMEQYPRIFSTARIPTENGCVMQTDPGAKHIVVLCHSQFYWFDVLDDNSDLIMTEKDIVENLESIINDAESTPIQEAAKSAVGVLSTENRRTWADIREVLTRDGDASNNSESLRIVDTALFVLCLDDASPTTGAELSMNMLCGTNVVEKGVQVGTCTNRWYDKLQIIVCKNGCAGINFEHTGVDGHTVLRMASDVYADTLLRFCRTINGNAPSLWASTSPDPAKRDPASFGDVCTTPHRLEWDMIPELRMALRFAETRLADLINQNEFETLEFTGYGGNFIKSAGFSPDAFVQMAFQAAYYGLYGRVDNTYEPAMTKGFLHGRTEAIRTVSDTSHYFVRKFCQNAPAEEKIDALRRACTQHSTTTRECAKGMGHDRHLYALFCIWQRGLDEDAMANVSNSSGEESPTGSYEEYEFDSSSEVGRQRSISNASITGNQPPARLPAHIPSIFTDGGWDKANTTILSTSNCGNPSLRAFGFGPTAAEGFGIGYIIKDNSICISASSKHRQTKRFMDTLQSYFLEVRSLLKIINQGKEKKLSGAREAERSSELSRSVRRRAVVRSQSGRPVSFNDMKEPDGSEGGSDDGDDGGMLGGYGYFDAGSFINLLKKREREKQHPKVVHQREESRSTIGRKIKLAEY